MTEKQKEEIQSDESFYLCFNCDAIFGYEETMHYNATCPMCGFFPLELINVKGASKE